MYFKIADKDSAIYKAVDAHLKEIESCHEICREFTRANGGTQYSFSGFLAVGPVLSILSDQPPAGWREDKEDKGWWVIDRRTKAGKALQAQVEAMPYVRKDAICGIIGYDFDQYLGTAPGGGLIRSFPGVGKREDAIIICIHQDAKYTPQDGMIEITKSEFDAIDNIVRLEYNP